ncbi:MAG: ABC-F family ATP-binding cassette domain-containing protein [Clostridiales bacterium]|jgi:ATP-binding cassette subfamily F protein 3|nr:ABC-F family ATP-binding cassette domain-containing protein [Clostridiales bacterium]
MVFSCKNIQKTFGAAAVLSDISFVLEDGEKAAVVGVNGAGKTTFFKILTGELPSDGGEVMLRKSAKIGYLSQMKDLDTTNTIYREMLTVFEELIRTEEEIRRLEKEMAGLSGEELQKTMEKYSRLTHWFEEERGFEYKSRIRGVIKGLGFSEAEADGPIAHLSGGQKTRISLGKLLLTQPDLLLLDEPTNHLDIESVSWLEDSFIKNYPGSVLVISHDRYFLDKTVTKIIEIENGKSSVFQGSYTYYAFKKEAERESRLKQYLDQQKEIKRQQEVIQKLKSFNREKSIKRAESREKLLAKMERIDRPENAPEKMRMILEPALTSGNEVLHVENVKKAFDAHVLFENVSFDIARGEIVALIGANGIGKTTLFKMIAASLGHNGGIIKLGTNVHIGYYDQEYALLNEDKTVFDEIADAYPKLKNVEIRNVLAAFVFVGDDVFKPIAALSGGEKGRVALAKLMLSNANFLMLDEPTNHLDMFSKEILEEALRNYTGTVFYISHDRYFINNTADKIIDLTPKGIRLYLGNYDYYIEKKPTVAAEVKAAEPADIAKDDYRQKKEKQAEERKRAARIQKLEKEIERTEQKIADCDEALAQPEVYTDHIKAQETLVKKTTHEKQLELFYEEWSSLQD